MNHSRLDALTLEERFMRFVEPEPMSGCWIWLGCQDRKGYGRFRWPHARETKLAHRVSYFIRYAVWPKELDHLCRVTSCVNPSHLEFVTSRENTRRGLNVIARNMQKTHCPKGHPYDALYVIASGPVRQCHLCKAEQARAYYARKKATCLS
jgi:hypothetical protein